MTGELEATNSPYAMATNSHRVGKFIEIQYGHKVINLMPTILDGPNDNFSDKDSHVIPGLMGRMHKTKIQGEKEFEVWGTGKPLREFLYVDDLANAITFIIENNIEDELINIGSNQEIYIKELVNSLMEVIVLKEITLIIIIPMGILENYWIHQKYLHMDGSQKFKLMKD